MQCCYLTNIAKSVVAFNNKYYYTTQEVRGPITKINQSKCFIAGPIFFKYRTGHCPEWSCTCVFALFSRVINLLLTKLARDRTGRISALRSFLYRPRCARSVLSRPRADILPVRPSRLVNKIYVNQDMHNTLLTMLLWESYLPANSILC